MHHTPLCGTTLHKHINPSPSHAYVHAPRSKSRAPAHFFTSDVLCMQQSSLRAARGYADRRVRWSNRSAPPASVASSAPSNAGGKQLAPMRSRISCIDAEFPLAQNLSHQTSISEFQSAALQNLHPRRSGRPPVGANLRGNPAGSRAEQAPARRARRPAAASAAAPPGAAYPPCPASKEAVIGRG